jgi:sugar/nucleoside kinase (ribokinase family)
MTKILTIGNALVDIMTILESDEILNILNLPKASMQLVNFDTSKAILQQTDNLEKLLTLGGSAANTARSLAMLGTKTGYIGKVGNDEYGKFFTEDTIKAGVQPHLIKSDNPTGTAIALVSKDSERTFATFLGAAAEMTPDEIIPEMFQGYNLIHIEGYLIFNNALIEKALITAKNAGLKISLDMASFNVVEANLDFLKNIVSKYVDILFANEEEAKAFTGKEPQEALNEIAEMCEIAIVKVGAQGSLIKTNNKIYKQGVIDVNPVDTTGAGDNYAAGFLFGLVNNMEIEKCAKIGTILSGNVIEVIGTTMNEQKWTNIKKLCFNI